MKKSLRSIVFFLILVILMQIPLIAFAEEVLPPETGEPVVEVGFVTKDDGNTYYINENGEYAKGFLVLEDGSRYYLDAETSVLQTGSFTVENKTYLADDETGLIHKGWYENGGYKYYYSTKDGHMLKGWHTLGNYKYYFDENSGRMFTGWHTIDGYRYYFCKSNGHMLKGWHTLGGYKYYFSKKSGHMLKGWHTLGGYEYYFCKKNGHMLKGWHTLGDYKYYFSKKNGHMLKGLHKLGDNVYTFNDKGRLIRTVYASKKSVCLTYDDGPSDNTASILNTLKSNGALATFFVVGERVSWYPDSIKSMSGMGCQIGNHSYTHPYYSNLSSDQIKSQIKKCNSAVKDYAGVKPTVCRTPGGGQSSAIKSAVGMPIILWSIDTLDWKVRNADSVYSNALSNVKDGSVILMHDLYASTAEATKRIVPALKNKGFQMVTVEEMVLLKGITLKNGCVYTNF